MNLVKTKNEFVKKFFMGKDILRPKRCQTSDMHFKVFLRANKS